MTKHGKMKGNEMGWAKTNELYRLYFEGEAGTYLLVDMNPKNRNPDGSRLCLGEVMRCNDPEKPRLGSLSVSEAHLQRKCERIAWDDLPDVWEKAFLSEWFNREPIERPEDCPGLWHMPDNASG